jgi:hypothetical protein
MEIALARAATQSPPTCAQAMLLKSFSCRSFKTMSFYRFAGEPDFSQKHPLETKWTLWFDNPNGKQKQSQWGQTLRAVYTFDTVEDFWW